VSPRDAPLEWRVSSDHMRRHDLDNIGKQHGHQILFIDA
jgi:hypothetical protein